MIRGNLAYKSRYHSSLEFSSCWKKTDRELSNADSLGKQLLKFQQSVFCSFHFCCHVNLVIKWLLTRTHFLGRLFDRVDLIISVCPSVHAYVHACVRPSTRSFFDFNDIWHVGRGRWLMHDGMQYDPIQGRGQGHEPFKVRNLAIFQSCLRHSQWELATDNWFLNQGTISKFDQAGFLIFGLDFVSRDFEVDRKVIGEESTVSPVWG